ncbi:hypothetical protein NPIL_35231 [Nephila pilipes]|uniref:Uncharacterized protein n=1 Tax=Nephila pilipes TaxID=299642 RepID=A0A8X6NAG8_NEPPI|nr:hypothetical protein NPIL_35231 [Nephila pilipes]
MGDVLAKIVNPDKSSSRPSLRTHLEGPVSWPEAFWFTMVWTEGFKIGISAFISKKLSMRFPRPNKTSEERRTPHAFYAFMFPEVKFQESHCISYSRSHLVSE